MSGFSELIKNFGKTRDYVRDFFIYGFKVRNEFDRKSARTYDDEKRRVESWLGDFIKYDTDKRGKQVCISVDSGHISENPLYKAYYSKSFTDNDIKLHFLLLDILSDGKPLSLRDITDRLTNDYGEIFDEQTVRNKLKEYSAEGIFITQKQGKTAMFSLSPDTPEGLFAQYEGLSDAVKFCSESAEFGVIGNSLLKSADMKNDLFLIKHNYIVHTLEDEILLKILKCIEGKKLISFLNFGKRKNESEITGIPLKIYVSSQTGRRYLIMYHTQLRRMSSYRLDFIKSVKPLGDCPDYDLYADMLRRNEKNCFGVSFGCRKDGRNVERFRMLLHIDEKNEDFVIERLKREKRCGEVSKVGDDLFMYTAEVFDANELMHWVKSYIGRIVFVDCDNENLIKKFRHDIMRMYRIYCKEEQT